MKFKCSRFERTDKTKWHRWFAWRPVRVSETTCVWLGWVYRKGTRASYVRIDDFSAIGHEEFYWEYEYMEYGTQ